MTKEQEEAIKYLKESVLIYKNTISKMSNTIDTVLSLIKEQQDKIAKYEKIYKEYDCYRWVKELDKKDKQIQELEEEIAMLKKASNIAKEVNIEDVTDVINKSCKEFMSNYIPKQVIIDKIKEYDKKMEEDAGHPNWVITDRIVINVLQELLEGDAKK